MSLVLVLSAYHGNVGCAVIVDSKVYFWVVFIFPTQFLQIKRWHGIYWEINVFKWHHRLAHALQTRIFAYFVVLKIDVAKQYYAVCRSWNGSIGTVY